MRETHEKSKTGHVERKRFPFNVACFVILARHPSSGPGCARSTFPGGEGFLRRGTLYFSPSWTCRGPLHTRPCGATLGKHRGLGIPCGKRGRLPCVKGAVSPRLTEGSPCCRLGPPHTRQGLRPCHPLPGEGRSPHPSRLTASHLPRRGRLPPAGKAASGGGLVILAICTIRCVKKG